MGYSLNEMDEQEPMFNMDNAITYCVCSKTHLEVGAHFMFDCCSLSLFNETFFFMISKFHEIL